MFSKKTESFKTKQRFEYFHTFKSEPELLDEINYVLKYTNKSPIVSLDNIDNEIAEEAINYSLDKKLSYFKFIIPLNISL